MTPLTHHDVVRHAAPLVRGGLRIDAEASARASRRILFRPTTAGEAGELRVLHALSVLADGGVELVRAVADPSGLVGTLTARAASAAELVATFAAIAPERQIARGDGWTAAFSRTLEPAREHGGSGGARLQLQQILGFAGPLCLIVDISTGDTMPADALLTARGDWSDHLRDTLASGAVPPQRQVAARRLLETAPGDRVGVPDASTGDTAGGDAAALLAALPDDMLAVLGPEWRPIVWQGTRWKGVLRLLGREPARSERAESLVRAALAHVAHVVAEPPSRYHARHAAARRRVFVRRLRPAMALLAILAVMPLSWLVVGRGGIQMHPLALGLTPLLMVGVVLLSAREIPVLELPPLPRSLAADRWRVPSPTAPADVASRRER